MKNEKKLKGINTILPTSFKKNGSFDEESFRKNINKICNTNVNSIMTLGTTGEFFNISFLEYKNIVDILIDEVSSRIKIIVGASDVNIQNSIKKTKYAEKKGIDAVINVVPFYQPLEQNEIVNYFTKLSNECKDISILSYNNNITTNVLISSNTYQKLSKIKNFIGSKEITTDFFYYTNIKRAAPNLELLPVEGLIVPGFLLGCEGFFSSIIFINPKFQDKLYKNCKNKNWNEAIKMQYKINKFLNEIVVPLRKKYNEISLAKSIINASGFINVGYPRSPYIPVNEKDQIQLRKNLEKICPYLIYE